MPLGCGNCIHNMSDQLHEGSLLFVFSSKRFLAFFFLIYLGTIAGKLLGVLLNGLNDRNSTVKKTFGSTIGNLVKVTWSAHISNLAMFVLSICMENFWLY